MLLHSSHNSHHGHFASTTRMQRTSHPSRKLQMMPAGKPSCLGITWCASCSQHLRLSNRHQVGVSWHWPWPQTLLGHVFLSFSPKKNSLVCCGYRSGKLHVAGLCPRPGSLSWREVGDRLEIGDESMDNAKTSKTFELDNRLPVMVGRLVCLGIGSVESSPSSAAAPEISWLIGIEQIFLAITCYSKEHNFDRTWSQIFLSLLKHFASMLPYVFWSSPNLVVVHLLAWPWHVLKMFQHHYKLFPSIFDMLQSDYSNMLDPEF